MTKEDPIERVNGYGLYGAFCDVEDFHSATGLPVYHKPARPELARQILRMKLIRDEVEELADANALHEIAGELVDIIYVCIGMAHEYGIPLDVVWEEVHAANMRKVDPETGKVKYREDGKVLKPDGWKPADLESIIADFQQPY